MAQIREIMAAGVQAQLARMLGSNSFTTVAASGNTQATATRLRVNYAALTTTADNQGVRLGHASGAALTALYNVGPSGVTVYPAEGDAINQLAPNVGLLLTAGSTLLGVPSVDHWLINAASAGADPGLGFTPGAFLVGAANGAAISSLYTSENSAGVTMNFSASPPVPNPPIVAAARSLMLQNDTDWTLMILNSLAPNAGGLAGVGRRGSYAAPAPVQAGDYLATFGGAGVYNTAGAVAWGTAEVDIKATQTFSATSQGTSIEFWATPDGTATEMLTATFDPDIGLHINCINPTDYSIVYCNGLSPQGGAFIGTARRGSFAAPLPVLAGDYLSNLNGSGVCDTLGTLKTGAEIDIAATENWSPTANGARFEFWACLPGTNQEVQIGQLDPTRGLTIWGNNPATWSMVTCAGEMPQGGAFVGRGQRGSYVAPLPVQANDYLAAFNGSGTFNTTTGVYNTAAEMDIAATENWSPTATGGRFEFWACLTGTTQEVQIGRWDGASGLIVTGNVTATEFITAPSDPGSKRDIADLPGSCLDLVAAVAPKTFRYRAGDDQRTHWGFMAPDIGQAMAARGFEFAGYCKDPSGQEGIAYNQLIPVLWHAVQELAQEVAALRRAV
jgi:hypothetical protein